MTGQFSDTTKVKIVSDDPSNLRVRVLYYLLYNSKNFSPYTRPSKQVSLQSDYNIISVFKEYKQLTNISLPEVKTKTKIIFDVSEDLFEDRDFGPVFLPLCICSDFVTCSDAYLQEKIYEYTGRLASIIANPNIETAKEVKPEPLNLKEFLWVGTISDIFSIRLEASKRKDIFVATDSFGTNIDNTLYFMNLKDKTKVYKKFDVIYLPKTFTDKSESRRLTTAKEATYQGKVVIAPELDSTMFFDTTLDEFKKLTEEEIRAKVEKFKTNIEDAEGSLTSIAQLEKAIEQSKNDNFFQLLEVKASNAKKDK